MEKVELRYWLEHSDEKNMNKLVEWKAFVDTYGIKSFPGYHLSSTTVSLETFTLYTNKYTGYVLFNTKIRETNMVELQS